MILSIVFRFLLNLGVVSPLRPLPITCAGTKGVTVAEMGVKVAAMGAEGARAFRMPSLPPIRWQHLAHLLAKGAEVVEHFIPMIGTRRPMRRVSH